MVNILIVDENLNYAVKLMNYLSNIANNLRIVYIAQSEDEMINIINNGVLDVDFIISSVKKSYYKIIINKTTYKDSFIIFSNGKVIDKNILLDFNTTMRNDIIKDITKINLIEEEKEMKNKETKIKEELSYLEYDFTLKGTEYLIKTIEYLVKERLRCNYILERDIYPPIARIYCTSIHNIKCNINRANDNMYIKCKIDKLKNYFGLSVDEKPKTKLIINTVISKIRK